MSACIFRGLVGKHFSGALTPTDERVMREHLPTCASCRNLYDRHLLLAELDKGGLASEERIARGLGLSARSPSYARAGGVLAFVAAAAAIVLFLSFPRGSPGSSTNADGFAARGSHRAVTNATTSQVFIYAIGKDTGPLRSGSTVSRNDELAFAYENGLARARLMIFGVDEHRHIYWFYPSWTVAADNPVAIPIETDSHRHELPDAIRHAFDGSTLEVHTLFVDRAISVREIEAMIAPPPPLPAPGTTFAAPLSIADSVSETTQLRFLP